MKQVLTGCVSLLTAGAAAAQLIECIDAKGQRRLRGPVPPDTVKENRLMKSGAGPGPAAGSSRLRRPNRSPRAMPSSKNARSSARRRRNKRTKSKPTPRKSNVTVRKRAHNCVLCRTVSVSRARTPRPANALCSKTRTGRPKLQARKNPSTRGATRNNRYSGAHSARRFHPAYRARAPRLLRVRNQRPVNFDPVAVVQDRRQIGAFSKYADGSRARDDFGMSMPDAGSLERLRDCRSHRNPQRLHILFLRQRVDDLNFDCRAGHFIHTGFAHA